MGINSPCGDGDGRGSSPTIVYGDGDGEISSPQGRGWEPNPRRGIPHWHPLLMISPPLSLGWRGLAYIVPSSEFGPSDQTDIDRTVFLDPLGRWNTIQEFDSDWPRGQGGRPTPEPVRSPVRSRGFWTLLDVE